MRFDQYPLKTSPVQADLLLIDDVEDQSQSANGSTKKITIGTLPYLPSSGGAMQGELSPAVVTLADGSSVLLNAALGNDFRWALSGPGHTLAVPSNPSSGQPIVIAIKYGGSYTPLFNAVFDFGSLGQPAWSAAAGKTDYVGFRYDPFLNGGAGEWAFQGFAPGFTS